MSHWEKRIRLTKIQFDSKGQKWGVPAGQAPLGQPGVTYTLFRPAVCSLCPSYHRGVPLEEGMAASKDLISKNVNVSVQHIPEAKKLLRIHFLSSCSPGRGYRDQHSEWEKNINEGEGKGTEVVVQFVVMHGVGEGWGVRLKAVGTQKWEGYGRRGLQEVQLCFSPHMHVGTPELTPHHPSMCLCGLF